MVVRINPDVEEKKRRFLSSFGLYEGNVSKALVAAGISRSTYDRWRKGDPQFAGHCAEVVEALIDRAEDYLQANIKDGQNQAIIFFLKTRGKHRGYVERQEISGPDGQPLDLVNRVTVNLAVLTTKELEQLQQIASKISEADGAEQHEPADDDEPFIPRLIELDATG